jgi:hypothetical protein
MSWPSLIKITIFVLLLYMHWGYYSLGKLATVQGFSLNLMTNNSAQNFQKCKKKINLFSLKTIIITTSMPIYHTDILFDNKLLSQFFLCVEAPNYCCVKLWVYPKSLHTKKHSVKCNESLYLLLTSWMLYCVEMFKCTDSLWKGMT